MSRILLQTTPRQNAHLMYLGESVLWWPLAFPILSNVYWVEWWSLQEGSPP